MASGCAILLAVLDRGPAISGALFDLGETLSDGRREILPPSVTGSDGIHVHVHTGLDSDLGTVRSDDRTYRLFSD